MDKFTSKKTNKGEYAITHSVSGKEVIVVATQDDAATAIKALSSFYADDKRISEARMNTWKGAIIRAIARSKADAI